MAGHPVKLFQFIQKLYDAVGIHSSPPHQTRCSFNRRIVIFLICSEQSILSASAFLLFEAKSVLDIGISVFFLLCLFLGLISYLIPVWQMGNISEFIESCEAFIETSKCRCIKRIPNMCAGPRAFNGIHFWYTLFFWCFHHFGRITRIHRL